MALQRVAIASPTNNSFNNLPATSVTAGAVGLAAAITVGTTTNVTDHLIVVSVAVGAITPAASTTVNVFVYASADGTKWPGGGTAEVVDGTDKQLTLPTTGNELRFLGSIPCNQSGTTLTSEPLNISAAFGGSMPAKYQVVIQNATGAALAASGHSVTVSEVYYT